MARFAVKTLEFDKVKALLASKTATSLGKAQALAIRTESEFSIVKRLQEETAEALRLLDEGKRFPFGGAHNIVAAVKHAQLGAVLEAETLMEIYRRRVSWHRRWQPMPKLCSRCRVWKNNWRMLFLKKARSKTVLRQSLAAYGLAFR